MNTYRNAEVLELLSRGLTYTQAAEATKLTRNQVAGIVYRHKTPKAKRRRKPQLIRAAGMQPEASI